MSKLQKHENVDNVYWYDENGRMVIDAEFEKESVLIGLHLRGNDKESATIYKRFNNNDALDILETIVRRIRQNGG